MADNVFPEAVVSAASFAFRTDDLGGSIHAPATKILLGGDATDDGFVSASNPLPVSLASVPSHAVTNAGTFAVQAAQTGTWTVTGAGGTFPVTDSGSSLTVDAPAGTPLFVRLSDGTSAISTLPVSLANVPSHDVTNAGTFAVQAAQTGTWTVTGAGGSFPVTDSGSSLTVDAPVGTPLFVRLSDGTSAISTLPVSLANVPSHDVTNAGTFAVQAAQTGTWTVTGAGGTFPVTDSGGSLTVDAPAGTPLFVRLSDGTSAISTLPVSLANVPSHDVTNAGTFAVQAAQTGTWTVTGTGGTFPVTDSGGSLTVDSPVGTPLFVRLSDGTSAISTLPVSLASVPSHAVTNAGTFAVQAAQTGTWTVTGAGGSFPVTDSGSSLTVDAPVGTPLFVRLSDGTSAITALNVNGSTAHDAVDANNPIKLGARAISTPSTLTLVAAADRTDLFSGTDGILVVRNHTTLDDVVSERATNTDGASTAFTGGLAAPGAGVRLCITAVTICNSSSAFCTVDLRDGTAGSVLWTLPVPATGGVVQRFDPPLKLTANTALAFDASAATTTVTISANGFKTKL